MTPFEKFMAAVVVVLLAVASPLIYEQGSSDIQRTDEVYWLEHGYPPLDYGFPSGVPDEK